MVQNNLGHIDIYVCVHTVVQLHDTKISAAMPCAAGRVEPPSTPVAAHAVQCVIAVL